MRMLTPLNSLCLTTFTLVSLTTAQTFQRLGTCPSLACILPPDQTAFLPGQLFDIRLELHAPQNGSEALLGYTVPDERFTFTITRQDSLPIPAAQFFRVAEPKIERWKFSWYEDLFAREKGTPSVVRVVSKKYEKIALYEPGRYTAEVRYRNGTGVTTAEWMVRGVSGERRVRNVVLFIGDGLSTAMISAARLLAHRSINGRYQSLLSLDTSFPILGHAMPHAVDSFISDSAGSATALFTGHKTSLNAAGVYVDSHPSPFAGPRIQTVAELAQEVLGAGVGVVTTASVADTTIAPLVAKVKVDGHRWDADVVEQLLNGAPGWTTWRGFDVLMGGGAEQFFPNNRSFKGKDYYKLFREKGYQVVRNGSELTKLDLSMANGNPMNSTGASNNNTSARLSPEKISRILRKQNTTLSSMSKSNTSTTTTTTYPPPKTLGIFTVGNLAVWLDRNVYKKNLLIPNTSPTGSPGPATDQPGLREMTLSALTTLSSRSRSRSRSRSQSLASGSGSGFFLMAEAASIDKQMHALDYDRALADVLELDDTVRATLAHLEKLGELDDTLVLVTADHGHGFDVTGSVDTQYLAARKDARVKREAVGVVEKAGLSMYTVQDQREKVGSDRNRQDGAFPRNWDPRYTLQMGVSTFPDRIESYRVRKGGPREAFVNRNAKMAGMPADFMANPLDGGATGLLFNGSLPVGLQQGQHSLTDVPVFARGPCQELFGGVYDNVEIFFGIAECMGLGRTSPPVTKVNGTGKAKGQAKEKVRRLVDYSSSRRRVGGGSLRRMRMI